MSPPALDVVIVSYRSQDLLGRCLDSLQAHPAPGGMTVTVVDNASNDGTAEMVSREYPQVRLLAQTENLGFAAATNLGVAAGEAPFVLALNPDAAIEVETLPVLLGLMAERPEVGCAGCALYQEDGTFDHASRRAFPTPMSALGHFSGIGRRLGGGRLAAYRATEVERGEVDAVNGAFMLLRRSALEQVHGFDETYWMYMEDLDLNWRLRQAGWKTWFEPSVRATHTKGGTTGGHRDPRLQIAFHRGMGRFYRKHYAPERTLPFNALVYAGIGAKLAASLLAGTLARR